MYRKVTLLFMVAVSVTLSMATVASTAPKTPKETRTVCQDGVTKEMPAHAKAKGATEGPCETTEEPPDYTLAESTCLSQFANYSPRFIPPDTCEYTVTDAQWAIADSNVHIYYNGVHQVSGWGEGGWTKTALISYELTDCFILEANSSTPIYLDLNDPRCQIPLG